MMETHWNWYPIFGQTQLWGGWFGYVPMVLTKLKFPADSLSKAVSVAALPPGAAENFAASWSRGLPWVRGLRSAAVENGFKDDVSDNFRTIPATMCHCSVILWCRGSFKLMAQLLQRCIWMHLEHHSSFTCHVISFETGPAQNAPKASGCFAAGASRWRCLRSLHWCLPQCDSTSDSWRENSWQSKVAHQCFKRWAHPTFCTSFSSRVLRSHDEPREEFWSSLENIELAPTDNCPSRPHC